MKKPARLEINTKGVWHLIGLLDAADDEQSQEVLAKAEDLAKALIWSATASKTKLRLATNDAFRLTVCIWTLVDGWRDPRTGDPI